MTEKYKLVVVDTNIFMHQPDAIHSFGLADVHIPYGVIDELDHHKKGVDEANYNSRRTIGLINSLEGDYSQGVSLGEGYGKLYIPMPEKKSFKNADEEILYYLNSRRNANEEVPILITNDLGLRIKARAQGFKVQGYETERRQVNLNQFLGLYQEINLDDESTNRLKGEGKISLANTPFDLFQNQYLAVRSPDGREYPVRYEFSGEHNLHLVKIGRKSVMGIEPRNLEQKCLADLCLNEEINAGTVIGRAGTGKTLMTLASAMDQLNHEGKYNRIIVIRANIEIGRELGFMPGDYSAKIERHFGSIIDTAELIFRTKTGRGIANSLDTMLKNKTILFETLNYMRGRNLANSFVIIDEAQNLSKEEAKTLVTRIGEGSKVMLLGDPYQIDNHANDEKNNGLVHVTKRLLGSDIFGTVILDKGERGRLAELAARKL